MEHRDAEKAGGLQRVQLGPVRRTVLDKAKSEINGKTDILFDYAVYEKDRQRVIAISVTIEPVDKQVADQKLNGSPNCAASVCAKDDRPGSGETGTLDDDPNILTLDYVSVPETTIPYSYGATPDLMAQELGVKAELDKLALVLAPRSWTPYMSLSTRWCGWPAPPATR